MILLPTAAARTALAGALLLAFAGCTSPSTPVDSSVTHPANAQADVSPVPPLPPSLLAVTNRIMIQPINAPAPDHQHGHPGHQAKPKAEEKK